MEVAEQKEHALLPSIEDIVICRVVIAKVLKREILRSSLQKCSINTQAYLEWKSRVSLLQLLMDIRLGLLKVLGTDELNANLNKYRLELDPHLEALVGRDSRKPWSKFIHAVNQRLVAPEWTSWTSCCGMITKTSLLPRKPWLTLIFILYVPWRLATVAVLERSSLPQMKTN